MFKHSDVSYKNKQKKKTRDLTTFFTSQKERDSHNTRNIWRQVYETHGIWRAIICHAQTGINKMFL